MSSNSNGDSTLKDKIPALRALSISNLVLPTPEKTTLDESTPASNAFLTHPLIQDLLQTLNQIVSLIDNREN